MLADWPRMPASILSIKFFECSLYNFFFYNNAAADVVLIPVGVRKRNVAISASLSFYFEQKKRVRDENEDKKYVRAFAHAGWCVV